MGMEWLRAPRPHQLQGSDCPQGGALGRESLHGHLLSGPLQSPPHPRLPGGDTHFQLLWLLVLRAHSCPLWGV